MTEKLMIVFGGSSEERLVSVASAQNIATHLPEAKLIFISKTGALHEVAPVELAQHQNPFTVEFNPQTKSFAGSVEAGLGLFKNHVLILALHGTEGEDGSLQKILEKGQIAFTGTASQASALAFDKKASKEIAQKAHLPIAQDLLVQTPLSAHEAAELKSFFAQNKKMVLKPVANGSSVGLYIIHDDKAFFDAIQKLYSQNSGPYLAESFLEGREITVGVRQTLDGKLEPLPCSEVRVVQGRQFDYQGKYLGHGVQELTPAPIDPEMTGRCQELAMKLHAAIGCEGYSRTDMILTERGPVVLEINTLPGLSKASFIPQQLQAKGETLRSFFMEQVQLASRRLERQTGQNKAAV